MIIIPLPLLLSLLGITFWVKDSCQECYSRLLVSRSPAFGCNELVLVSWVDSVSWIRLKEIRVSVCLLYFWEVRSTQVLKSNDQQNFLACILQCVFNVRTPAEWVIKHCCAKCPKEIKMFNSFSFLDSLPLSLTIWNLKQILSFNTLSYFLSFNWPE